MKQDCRLVRERLARGDTPTGMDVLHLEVCSDCARVRAELGILDGDLAALRAEPPTGFADAVMTLAVADSATEPVPNAPWWRFDLRHPQLAPLLAFLLAALLLPFMGAVGQLDWDRARVATSFEAQVASAPLRPHWAEDASEEAQAGQAEKPDAQPRAPAREEPPSARGGAALGSPARAGAKDGRETGQRGIVAVPLQNRRVQDIVALFPGVTRGGPSDSGDISVAGGASGEIGYRLHSTEDAEHAGASDPASASDRLDGEDNGALLDVSTGAIEDFVLIPGGFSAQYGEQSTGIVEIVDERRLAESPAHLDGLLARLGVGVLDATPEEWRHVRLDRPVYFENTYLGGNARLALLDDLAQGLPGAPHRAASLPPQWFDPPAEGGMALHVDLDRAHLDASGAQRVFLQVGLKGGENLAWQRPPASIVVLALGDPEDDTEWPTSFDAALGALREGLDPRDLIAVATPESSVRFTSPDAPSAMSTGDAPVAWFDDDSDLARALRGLPKAFGAVETRGAVRNRRVVLLAGDELGDRVENAAHRLALVDVTTTVISLEELFRDSHARVALAGQGNLHAAESPAEAAVAAQDELAAMLRVVARALRLDIRPAKDVKLIQVLGSRPLKRPEVRQVKAAEKAVDRHVEETTGIAADRGADDPGLQTVIPAFLGGDEHVVLVELEVRGPGPVAEVSLQYKDMVDVRNRRLRASVALARWAQPSSARQELVRWNVLGFLVARELRVMEERADVRPLGPADARQLRELAASLPLPRFEADRRLLTDYAALVDAGASGESLARSLEHARRARLGLSR